jgi:CRISPR/Cas system Type II protein with McrA/HNH and RuvC-like nuclease domain
MTAKNKVIFGFDLGTNSIGWAVWEEDTNGNPSEGNAA